MTSIQLVGVALVVLGLLVAYLARARAAEAQDAHMLAVRMELAAVQRCIIRAREVAALGDNPGVIREIDAASKAMLCVALVINGQTRSGR